MVATRTAVSGIRQEHLSWRGWGLLCLLLLGLPPRGVWTQPEAGLSWMPWCLCRNETCPHKPTQGSFANQYTVKHSNLNHRPQPTHVQWYSFVLYNTVLDTYCHREYMSVLHSQRGLCQWKRSLLVLSVQHGPDQTKHHLLQLDVDRVCMLCVSLWWVQVTSW